MIQTHTRTIDGETFEIRQLGFTAGLQVFTRLSNTIGPALAAFLAEASSIEAVKNRQVDPAALARTAGELLAKLKAEDVSFLCQAFSACQWVDPETGARPVMHPATQEKVFAGRLLLCFKWLAACIEVNFADFFSALGGAKGGALPSTQTPEG